MSVTPQQLQTILTAAIPARLPVLITGAPGIGKSDIVAQAAQQAQADLLISHPVVEDPTDAKGLPWQQYPCFIKFKQFNQMGAGVSYD